MAGPAKKRDIKNKIENNDEIDNEEDSKIMVDFVGRTPEDCDLNGIRILLKQLFLKSHVDVTSLAEHIISRNYVGSIVKQELDGEDEDDDDEDDNDINDVFGITTVVNISTAQNEKCVKQLRELFKDLATEFADDKTNTTIKNILENDAAALGLIINERFVNIPADISVPLLDNLVSDMKRATKKKMPYEFQYYVLISKLYKMKGSDSEVFWSNQEEEIFTEEELCSFEFSVEKESSTGLSGTWSENDAEMTPFRRITIIEADKLPKIINKIKSLF